MRILHLVSGNRWTGAASPAFFETVALRETGIDALYAYVGGYNLQDRVGHLPWTVPLIEKQQNPASFLRNAGHLFDFVRRENIDVLHAHLTHDHSLALWAARGTTTQVVRTFRSHRAFRRNMLTRLMIRQTAGVSVVNAAFRDYPMLAHRSPLFTPPPIDHRIFTPGPDTARSLYGLSRGTTVIGVIGKIAVGRGFEDAIETFRLIRERAPGAKLMIVGKGAHRPALEELTRRNGTSGDVIWTGYQDGGLVPHFRAMDVLLFTATGSDEGHRATTEAMACGTPVAAWPLRGVRTLLGGLADELVADDRTHEALATKAVDLLARRSDLSELCVESTARFDLARTSARLEALYSEVLSLARREGDLVS
jgi:glycosyltransferase involved in cell wall biosynthesis